MSMQIKFKLTRLAVICWPAVPKAVKVALYKHHRKQIETRTKFF